MPNKNRTTDRTKIIGAAVFILLIAIGAAYIVMHRPKHASSGIITASSPQSSQSKSTAPSSQKSSVSSDNESINQKSDAPSSSNSSVVLSSPPTGTFVSNHHPSLDGSPTPSSEQSTCNTTPGASCYIKFTQGNVVKTLPSKIADSEGAVIWNWDVNQAGFTKGTWQITAIATAGSKSFQVSDSMSLEVQ